MDRATTRPKIVSRVFGGTLGATVGLDSCIPQETPRQKLTLGE
jgi:hypothetical protein